MKIYSMTATFGKLENQTLTLKPGLNRIEAPNEWGKTTWCAFLTAMLYGIDTRERTTATVLAVKDRYAPWSGAPMAGRIDLHWNGKDITIERTSAKRIPLGEFKAYETASGVAVPELTGDNCGKQLLGVEKSVFQRTGFIRLTDMPVTQDEALRRRLNELVTTGDESGQSDALAQKLRDLKNKVRSNRSNGLIPQALAEKAQLEAALQQLETLQSQAYNLQNSRQELAERTARLRNHQSALDRAAAQERTRRYAQVKAQLAAATEQMTSLTQACENLPSHGVLQQQLASIAEMQHRKDAVQLELAMLPTPPAPPRELPPHDPRQAQGDYSAYLSLSRIPAPKKPLFITAVASLVMALVGALTVLLTMNGGKPLLPILGGCLLAVGGIVAAICTRRYRTQKQDYTEAQRRLQVLTARYAPLEAHRWVAAAECYVNQQNAYQTQLAAYEAHRTQLQQRLQEVITELGNCPTEQALLAALEKRRALELATQEQHKLQQLAFTLEDREPMPEIPVFEDALTYTEPETRQLLAQAEVEARQLHTRLGQVQGQMETLGSADALQEKLQAVNLRLARLEQTYAALELAQSTLTQASNELQRRFAPAITQKAEEYFSRITGGRYNKLTLTQELTVEAATADEPVARKSQYRSDGTVDQLYLALRLAVADVLIPNAPLVLDDALVRFDDTRLAAALALLRQEAETRQVLLFTCQDREARHMNDQ